MKKIRNNRKISNGIIVAVLSFCLVCSIILPSIALDGENQAQTPIKPQQEATKQVGAEFEINSLATLQTFRNRVNAGESSLDGKVTASFSMAGESDWTPIGDYNSSGIRYRGTFNGDGYTISGLSITTIPPEGFSYAGLFGLVDGGTINNVILGSGSIVAGTYGGSIAGNAHGTINGCANRGVTVNGKNYIGGLIGSGGATITNSYNLAPVQGSGSFISGLVGQGSPTILNSYNQGNVSGSSSVGGILAYSNSANTKIESTYNTGTITSSSSPLGGIFGGQGTMPTITRSYVLSGSCSDAGGGTFKTAANFTSADTVITGVTYLLNQGRSTNYTWNWWTRQSSSPNYPIFDNTGEVIKVTVSWDTMAFKYDGTKMIWNPATHQYTDGGAWTPQTTDCNKITVTNQSTMPVTAALKFEKSAAFPNVSGFFTDAQSNPITKIDLQEGYKVSQTGNTYFKVAGCPPKTTAVNNQLGTITVNLARKQ